VQQEQPRAGIAGNDIGDLTPLDAGTRLDRPSPERGHHGSQAVAILRLAGGAVNLAERETDPRRAGVESGRLDGRHLRQQFVRPRFCLPQIPGVTRGVMQFQQEQDDTRRPAVERRPDAPRILWISRPGESGVGRNGGAANPLRGGFGRAAVVVATPGEPAATTAENPQQHGGPDAGPKPDQAHAAGCNIPSLNDQISERRHDVSVPASLAVRRGR